MVDRGLPCEDGQLDRTAALQWIVDSTSGSGGGWDADHGRVSLRERALAILAGPARRGRRKAKRTAEEAVLPPATSAEFDRGARWLAGELCVSARRVWPKFVGNLDMAIFPEEQRSAVRGLFVAIQTHLLERWVADFVDDAKLPPIDWAACFGAADAEHIRIECEQLQTSWKRTD
jgi:hypothetical protein